MSWRLAITHRTDYEYAGPVVTSYNEARLTPMTNLTQTTLESRVEVTPPARAYRYWDYWGTLVHAFDLHREHERLTVSATSVVQTVSAPVETEEEVPWDRLDVEHVRDAFYEFLAPSTFVDVDDELTAVATDLRRDARSPAEAVHLAIGWVQDRLAYEPGWTDVSTPATAAVEAGRGVCQDYAHVTLALLRTMGIPARYASGYLHTRPDAPAGEVVVGESHAWVEAWTGGWRSVDPTNDVEVGERHVLVALGRDYCDVSPIKGIYRGAPLASSSVAVELVRQSSA